jgi:hypothetical protein
MSTRAVIHLGLDGDVLTLCGRRLTAVEVIAPHPETCRACLERLGEARRLVSRGESYWRPMIGLMEVATSNAAASWAKTRSKAMASRIKRSGNRPKTAAHLHTAQKKRFAQTTKEDREHEHVVSDARAARQRPGEPEPDYGKGESGEADDA